MTDRGSPCLKAFGNNNNSSRFELCSYSLCKGRIINEYHVFVRRDQFLHWVESLAARQTPAWLGLPVNAEKVLLTTRGKRCCFCFVCFFTTFHGHITFISKCLSVQLIYCRSRYDCQVAENAVFGR